MKTVWMRTPIGHSLGWIAAQREQVFDAFLLKPLQYGARVAFRLANDSQMAHDLQTAAVMDGLHQIDGFFARASARPVRNRAKARIDPLNDFDFVKEVFLAFVRLWRKEFDR